jgi:hypothetical protein
VVQDLAFVFSALDVAAEVVLGNHDDDVRAIVNVNRGQFETLTLTRDRRSGPPAVVRQHAGRTSRDSERPASGIHIDSDELDAPSTTICGV